VLGIEPKKNKAEEREFYDGFVYRRGGKAGSSSKGAAKYSTGGASKYSARGAPKLSKTRKALLTVFTVFLCAALVFSAAELFSGGLALGIFSFGNGKSVQIKEQKYYAVETGFFTSDSDARAEAQSVKGRGGAGYIYNDGKFHVLAAAYATLSDAEKVKAQLGGNAAVYEVKTPALSIEFDGTKAQKETISKAFLQFSALYGKLYNLSVRLDLQEIGAGAVYLALAECENETRALITEFNAATGGVTTMTFIRLRSELTIAADALYSLCDITAQDRNLAADLKYAYWGLIFKYKDMMGEIG